MVVGEGFQREPPRNRFPLACLCLLSPRRESRPPEATGQGGRIAQASGESAARSENRPLRRGRKQDEGFSRCGATPFLLAEKKRGKETARGDLFRGGSLWTPSPTTKGAAAPLRSPGVYGGRETKDGGLDGGCGLPQPLRGFAMTGGQETKDEGRGCAMTGLGGGCVCPGFPVLAASSAPFLTMT